MDVDNPVEGLYHFFLIGLMWLREERPDILERRGSSVFSSLALSKSVFKSAKNLALESWDLRDYVCENSVIYNSNTRLGTKKLKVLIAESEEHNVILVVPSTERPTPEELFGPSGYSHAITDAGIEYATSVVHKYSDILTKEAFLDGWDKHRIRMASCNAINGPRSSVRKPGKESGE